MRTIENTSPNTAIQHRVNRRETKLMADGDYPAAEATSNAPLNQLRVILQLCVCLGSNELDLWTTLTNFEGSGSSNSSSAFSTLPGRSRYAISAAYGRQSGTL